MSDQKTRTEFLEEALRADPNNTFARYGLAMEYSQAGDVERALEEFRKLLSVHPDYAAGYFMAAQTLARVDRTPEARTMLEQGIAAAQRSGNAHAKSEMEAMLSELAE